MLLLLPLLAAASAARQSTEFDLQCLAAISTAAEKAEGQTKLGLTIASTYYFGRVDSEVRPDELEAKLEAEVQQLQGQLIAPMLKECGAFMEGRGNAMQAIGEHMITNEQIRKIQ